MNKGNKYYAAHGFFTNAVQMADKCPTAAIVGTGELKGYRLCFKGSDAEAVAVAAPDKDATIPIRVWEITPADEAALDRCEGFPALCGKEQVKVKLDGKTVTASFYVLNAEGLPLGRPSAFHYKTIIEGYEDMGLDTKPLSKALETAAEAVKASADEPL